MTDPQYVVSGFTNRRLQKALGTSPWAKGGTDKQLSARITRHLRLLRDHSLIRKMPNQRKYLLTQKGRTLTTALNALLAASTQQLRPFRRDMRRKCVASYQAASAVSVLI